MKKYNLILLTVLIFTVSCNQNQVAAGAKHYRAELSKNYPISLNGIKIYKERGEYYLDFSGVITNKTEHFLDELIFYPRINYKKSSGDYGNVEFESIKIVSYGSTLESGKSVSFKQKCRFKNFNPDNLKYNFDEATLDIFLKGKNSTGYKLGENYTVNGMTWHPAKTVSVLDEWKNIIR